MEFSKICRASDHDIDQCPSKIVSGSCPSRKIIRVHVVQTKVTKAPKKKKN
jgi:hypothetical protein